MDVKRGAVRSGGGSPVFLPVQGRIADIQADVDEHHEDVREIEPDGIGPHTGAVPGNELSRQAHELSEYDDDLEDDALSPGRPGPPGLGDIEGPGSAEGDEHPDLTKLYDIHIRFLLSVSSVFFSRKPTYLIPRETGCQGRKKNESGAIRFRFVISRSHLIKGLQDHGQLGTGGGAFLDRRAYGG